MRANDTIKARQLIDAASFGPDVLKAFARLSTRLGGNLCQFW